MPLLAINFNLQLMALKMYFHQRPQAPGLL